MFTPEQDEALKVLAVSSSTYTDAARALNVSSMMVQRRVKELGLRWVRGGDRNELVYKETGPDSIEVADDGLKPLRTVQTIRHGECRYPIGDPRRDKDFGLCGRKKYTPESGVQSPYCEVHHHRTHTKRHT